MKSKDCVDKEYTKCLRCGRTLKTQEARKLGYGPVCFLKKQQETAKKKLFML